MPSKVMRTYLEKLRLTFVDASGKTIDTIPIYDLTGNEADRDVELPRGALTILLYGSLCKQKQTYYPCPKTSR